MLVLKALPNGYITGRDAVDLAMLSGVLLRKAPCHAADPADTSWQAAEISLSMGEDPGLFYIDLDNLTSQEAGDLILALVGVFKAIHDFAPRSSDGAVGVSPVLLDSLASP